MHKVAEGNMRPVYFGQRLFYAEAFCADISAESIDRDDSPRVCDEHTCDGDNPVQSENPCCCDSENSMKAQQGRHAYENTGGKGRCQPVRRILDG